MPASVHDRTINFRASSKLINAARVRASERGMSLAELIREGVRYVTFDRATPAATETEALDGR